MGGRKEGRKEGRVFAGAETLGRASRKGH